jgi:hypothetical protein
MQGIAGLYKKELAAQEGSCSMELVGLLVT